MRYRVYYEVYSSYVRQMANGYREMTFSLRLTTESEEEARAEAERIKAEEGCDAWYEREAEPLLEQEGGEK